MSPTILTAAAQVPSDARAPIRFDFPAEAEVTSSGGLVVDGVSYHSPEHGRQKGTRSLGHQRLDQMDHLRRHIALDAA